MIDPFSPLQQKLYNQLKQNEGYKDKPYKDTVGKITIGVGRNLTDVGLSDDEIRYLWRNDIVKCENALDAQLSWWRSQSEVRQRVLLDLCFNMGITKLLTFKNTLAFWKAGQYDKAADNLLQSLWAHQVDKDLSDHDGRANRLADMLRTNNDAYT